MNSQPSQFETKSHDIDDNTCPIPCALERRPIETMKSAREIRTPKNLRKPAIIVGYRYCFPVCEPKRVGCHSLPGVRPFMVSLWNDFYNVLLSIEKGSSHSPEYSLIYFKPYGVLMNT